MRTWGHKRVMEMRSRGERGGRGQHSRLHGLPRRKGPPWGGAAGTPAVAAGMRSPREDARVRGRAESEELRPRGRSLRAWGSVIHTAGVLSQHFGPGRHPAWHQGLECRRGVMGGKVSAARPGHQEADIFLQVSLLWLGCAHFLAQSVSEGHAGVCDAKPVTSPPVSRGSWLPPWTLTVTIALPPDHSSCSEFGTTGELVEGGREE